MHPPLVPPILRAQGRGASSTQPQRQPPRRRRPYICKVSDVVEVSGKNVMQTSSVVTTSVVTHRYGDQASEITHYYLHATETLFNHWKCSSSRRDNTGLAQPGVCRALQPLGGGLRHEARRLRRTDDHPGYCDACWCSEQGVFITPGHAPASCSLQAGRACQRRSPLMGHIEDPGFPKRITCREQAYASPASSKGGKIRIEFSGSKPSWEKTSRQVTEKTRCWTPGKMLAGGQLETSTRL